MSDFPQSQNDMLIAKVDELQRQILAQRAEMRVLTESVTKLTAFVKQSMKSKRQRLGDTAVDDDFPISSDAELAEIDAKICKETRGNYIHYMKKILGQGRVSLTIKSIFSEEIIMAYNNDGTGNKKNLKIMKICSMRS
uniref:Uncharacterized protein LOC108050341 isoform X1 n=1 Tax=Drosophila rhopaloa TaxID=1041015 RepID=A0A6P4FQH0_DRORH